MVGWADFWDNCELNMGVIITNIVTYLIAARYAALVKSNLVLVKSA